MSCSFTSLSMQKPKVRYCITFKKDDEQPGRYQDLKTLDQLETMARESFISLQKQKYVLSSDAFSRLNEAKKQFNGSEEITIDKDIIKDFLSFIMVDGGRVEFWKFPDGTIVDLNVKLIDSREGSIFIEGPILNIAREAKFVTQKPNVQQMPQEENKNSSWWQKQCSLQ